MVISQSGAQNFAWHEADWKQVQTMRTRMPHAILLYGAQGTGKAAFAEHLAKSLLCEAPSRDGYACCQCASCGWFEQYSHPDYRRVRPELLDEAEGSAEDSVKEEADSSAGKSAKASKAPSKEIVIQQIRNLAQFMNVSTHRQGRRVILLYPAEALNVPASNALLKSLEEPNPNTVFILVSHSLDRLLPTILSRCHKIALSMPTHAQSLAWLKQQKITDPDIWLAQQGGAPLSALAMYESQARAELEEFLLQLCKPGVESSLKIAEKLQKSDVPTTVSWLQRWIYDIFSYKQAGIIRYYPRYQKELAMLSTRVELTQLMQALKNANKRQSIASHPLSAKLFIEEMMLDYSALFH